MCKVQPQQENTAVVFERVDYILDFILITLGEFLREGIATASVFGQLILGGFHRIAVVVFFGDGQNLRAAAAKEKGYRFSVNHRDVTDVRRIRGTSVTSR